LTGHGLTALLIEGGQGVIVRNLTQERFATHLCSADSAVVNVRIALARHRDTRPAGFEAALAWIFGRVAGIPPASTCGPRRGSLTTAWSPWSPNRPSRSSSPP